MFPESSDDTALDPISAARLYVETLCQQFPDASANLSRALAFQILIYTDQTDAKQWAQNARSSFEGKVMGAYPQTASEDFPAWPDVSPAQTEHYESQPSEAATADGREEPELGDDAEVALESEADSVEAREPRQRWFYHADLGELLGQIDDETGLLREAAHRMSSLLHDGMEEDGARQCREIWEQSHGKLNALWQQMEEFASALPAGERLQSPRDGALDAELERFVALFEGHPCARALDCENCHGELRELMMDVEERTEGKCGATLENWIAHWLRADVGVANGLLRELRALRAELEMLCGRALEDELEELLVNYRRTANNERADEEESHERRSEMLRQRLGWNGVARRTLADMAQEWGVSRERVRQIVGKLEIWIAETAFFTPVTERALQMVRESLPSTEPELARALQSSGITRGQWSLEALADTARSLGREAGFVLTPLETGEGAPFVVVWDGENGENNKPLPHRLWHAITTHIWERGIGWWPDLRREIADDEGESALALAQTMLDFYPAAHWLDAQCEWFWLDEARALRHQENRLLTLIVRALSVARRVSLARLYTAATRAQMQELRRGHAREIPPPEIFEAWCAGQDRFVLANGEIEMRATPPWREVLENTEATLVEVLEQNGPLLSRHNFYQLALAQGVPKPTFYRYVDELSTIEEVDDGVFALFGTSVMPAQLAEFQADYNNVPKRFQLRYGRLDDGRLWISYRIGQGIINNGCLNLPGAMQGEFEGQYELLDSWGSSVADLRFSRVQFWGLKTYFAGAVAVGNRATFLFDHSRRHAQVLVGFAELPAPILSEVEALQSSDTGEEDEE